MPKVFKFIDLSVHNRHFHSIQHEKNVTRHSFGYLDFIDPEIEVSVVRFGAAVERSGNYFMFDRFLSGRFLKFLSSEKNAVVLFHGFSFPLHFLFLRLLFPRLRWIVQHHAGNPSANQIKRFISKLAYSRADAFLFVSKTQAEPFVKSGIIRSKAQVHEIMECSTDFTTQDKSGTRKLLGIDGSKPTFIWVGNLNSNKDPVCALKALKKLDESGIDFKLYLFFNATDLLTEVKNFIGQNNLQNHVFLKGRIENRLLENWYSAADFFISCSHSEGSGIALAEAMACNCVPIVTSIPSFVTMTANGDAGFLFDAGNSDQLFNQLKKAIGTDSSELRQKPQIIFKERLSFEAIGKRTSQLVKLLHGK